MDKVLIKDLRVNGIIGIFDHERVTPQEILINITMNTDTRKAADTDDIAHCVDYDKVVKRLKDHTQKGKRMTVEALAEDLARICLGTRGVYGVTVRVEKPQAVEDTGSVGVEIERGTA